VGAGGCGRQIAMLPGRSQNNYATVGLINAKPLFLGGAQRHSVIGSALPAAATEQLPGSFLGREEEPKVAWCSRRTPPSQAIFPHHPPPPAAPCRRPPRLRSCCAGRAPPRRRWWLARGCPSCGELPPPCSASAAACPSRRHGILSPLSRRRDGFCRNKRWILLPPCLPACSLPWASCLGV
jgi:hypothetical protein